MSVREVNTPTAGEGEIVVEVYAVGLNPVDYKIATGGNPKWAYPHILGLDVAGVIVEIGEGVTHWKIGDRVVYHGDLTKQGGFAVQLAKLAGKQVISTASPHNHEYVKSLGADFVLDYRDEDIVSKVFSITNGRGVDAVTLFISERQHYIHVKRGGYTSGSSYCSSMLI
jgi:NADPH:quinone reductase-like Zn-dependent oxidoreductase